MKKMNLVLIGLSSLIFLLLISIATAVPLEHNTFDDKKMVGESYGVEMIYENTFKPSNLKKIEFPIVVDGEALVQIISNEEIIFEDTITGEKEYQIYVKEFDLEIPVGEYKLVVTSDKELNWALGKSSGKFLMIDRNKNKVEPKIRSKKYSFEHKLVFDVEDNSKPITTIETFIKKNKAKIQFFCEDEGSGCKSTYVKIGNGDYIATNYLILKHPATIYFHSIDFFGNIESTQTRTFNFQICDEEIIISDWCDWYVKDIFLEERYQTTTIKNKDDECVQDIITTSYQTRNRICEEDIIKGKWYSLTNCTNSTTYTEQKITEYINIDNICENNDNTIETREKNC